LIGKYDLWRQLPHGNTRQQQSQHPNSLEHGVWEREGEQPRGGHLSVENQILEITTQEDHDRTSLRHLLTQIAIPMGSRKLQQKRKSMSRNGSCNQSTGDDHEMHSTPGPLKQRT
jgi:hypothetical protein